MHIYKFVKQQKNSESHNLVFNLCDKFNLKIMLKYISLSSLNCTSRGVVIYLKWFTKIAFGLTHHHEGSLICKMVHTKYQITARWIKKRVIF